MSRKDNNMYVTFMLDGEYCGIEIDNVISIEKDQVKTRIPNGPQYVKGVINLRGEVIAVIDLRKRLGLEEKEADSNTRIIIVKNNNVTAGLLVDSSSEVKEISSSLIDNSPVSEENQNHKYISGVGKTKEGLVTLLDLEKILER